MHLFILLVKLLHSKKECYSLNNNWSVSALKLGHTEQTECSAISPVLLPCFLGKVIESVIITALSHCTDKKPSVFHE